MSLADESQISVSRVSKTAWGAALHAWRTGNWSQLSELQRLACRAAGTLDQDGCPQGIWHRALELSTRATSRTVLMARNGQVGFLSIVDRSVGDLLTVTSRVLLDDTTDTVTAMESSLEVALAPRSQAWPLLRRVMPPDTRFRSPAPAGPTRLDPLTGPAPSAWASDAENRDWVTRLARRLPEDTHGPQLVAETITGEGSVRHSWWLDAGSLIRLSPDWAGAVKPGDVATVLCP